MVLKKQIVVLPTIQQRRESKQEGTDLDPPSATFLKKIRILIGSRNGRLSLRRKTCKCKTLLLGLFAALSIGWGLLTLIRTPLDMLLNFRLEMTPGFPPYDWWHHPPQVVLLKAYVFNVTNAENFLNGADKKLKLQQVGPIIYREVVSHRNPQRNPNGTLTYVANRSLEYLPEMNTLNLNATIIAPNLGVLLIPAYFHDASFFFKLGVNTLLKAYKAQPFINMTVGDYLWNSSDPILKAAETIAPSLVPTKNLGLLEIVYREFQDTVTVFVGEQRGNSKFFRVDKFDGSEFLPHFSDPGCQVPFKNASEGVCYPQMITRDTNLSYWRKTVCKQSDIRYVRDEVRYGMNAYRFELTNWTYNRVEWQDNRDCFAGNPTLLDGLADVSPCYWGFPIAVSFPHYLNADKAISDKFEGLNPNEPEHGSYVIIEPTTGLPLEGKARAQMNILMKNMNGFTSGISRLKDAVIPIGWLEYHQTGVPWYLEWLIYTTAVLVPSAQLPMSIVFLLIGFVCFYLALRQFLTRQVPKDKLYKCKLVKGDGPDLVEHFVS